MNELEAQWQLSAAKLIFHERYAAALPIQRYYRRFRARRIVEDCVRAKAFDNALLADLPLAPYRATVRFTLSKSVRDMKRVIWGSCIKIQSLWRCYICRWRYSDWLRRVRTVQSFGRMTPAKARYRLMKLSAVVLQAWGRGVCTRRLYLELRRLVVLIQTTVRGYFAMLVKWQRLEAHWRRLESRNAAVLAIQNAFRGHSAARRVQLLRDDKSRRHRAALLLQRSWYRRNGFLHTFLLMGCYRELEIEHADFDRRVVAMERFYCARTIQRRFRPHYAHRLHRAATTVQRWYRGRRGFFFTCALRRYTYASRKLHHWGRAIVSRRNRCVRALQRVWWRSRAGRLLRHLEHKNKVADERWLLDRYRRRYSAATKLQASVRAVFAQRRYRLSQLALRIQRGYRRYRQRTDFKAFRASVVVWFSAEFVARVLCETVTTMTVMRMRSVHRLVALPQALVRGWLVRRRLLRSKQRQALFLRCVFRIQKFWRQQLDLVKSSVFRFLPNNPYAKFTSSSGLLRAVNSETSKLLSTMDARVGMALSTFLARLGLEEYLDMFPKARFATASDVAPLKLDDLVLLFETWQLRVEKDAHVRGAATVASPKSKKLKTAVPLDDLDLIARTASPKLCPSSSKHKAHVSLVCPVIELMSQESLAAFIKEAFMKKFGGKLATKAQNLATSVTEELYRTSAAYLTLGDTLTKGQILRCIAVASTSNDPKPVLLRRIVTVYGSSEEVKRHRQRCRACLRALEFAVQRLIQLLDAGVLLKLVFDMAKAVLFYKKRFKYVMSSKASKSAASGLVISKESIVRDASKVPSLSDLANRAFTGGAEYKDIELALCQCRYYLYATERLFIADRGFRLLHCVFRFRVYKAVVRRGRLQLFLNSEKQRYLKSRSKNLVRTTWDVFRRVERVAADMSEILARKLELRHSIEGRLKQIARFGFRSYMDDSNAMYWSDGFDSSYDMPAYSLPQWRAVDSMQRSYRRHLQRVFARRQQQLLEDQRRIELERKKAAAYTSKLVSFTMTVLPASELGGSGARELSIPRHLDLELDFHLRPRLWLLLKSSDSEPYKVVLVLRIRPQRGQGYLCDVRTVQDEMLAGVSARTLFKLNLDIGSRVEVRYKGGVLFYPGRVTSLKRSSAGMEHFNIKYDDGEFEANVPLILVRTPQSEVNRLVRQRESYIQMLAQREKRSAYLAEKRSTSKELAFKVQTQVVYTQKAPLFGWKIRQEKDTVVFINAKERVKSSRPKEYSPIDSAAVTKIQSLCRMHISKKRLKELLSKFTVEFISKAAIEDAKRLAFVGYQLEGVTAMQTLRRAGYGELAVTIESFLKEKPVQFSQVTIKLLVSLSPSKFATIGVIGEVPEKALTKFAEWWRKYKADDRSALLSFINYFESPTDLRSLEQCVLASEATLTKLFLKAYPNNATRVKSAVKALVASRFPLSRQQVEAFLHKYAGKPSVAQDRIAELVDVPTLHSPSEEGAVLTVYASAARRMCSLLKVYKIGSMLGRVLKALEDAQHIISDYRISARKESRAAWLLRVDAFAYIARCLDAAVVVQRFVRGFVRRHQYVRLLRRRLVGALTIQRLARRYLARLVCLLLRAQQLSIYEQLWDDRNSVLYYFNNVTGESSYQEPVGTVYRPLVRDWYSDSLIQAWPQIESPSTYLVSEDTADPSVCYICRARSTVRICNDCPTVSRYGSISSTSYCFPCFSTAHSDGKDDHQFTETDKPSVDYLECSECGVPATRKCLGFLSDARLKVICEDLKRFGPSEWEGVLRGYKVLDERKLHLLIDNVQTSGTGAPVGAQLQQLRSLLERVRAECDDCYCIDCYKDFHSGGKRAGHVWKGFKEYSPACSCRRAPAEVQCADCNDAWCEACFKVLHGMGKKRRHRASPVLESNPFNSQLCCICPRRVATVNCPRMCGFVGCDSCFECTHKEECPNKVSDDQISHACVVCNESADSRCVDCGDLYCSRRWMGNPGCFVKNHSKGNRVNHRSQSII